MHITTLQKYYPAISAIFILALMASFLFWPKHSDHFAMTIITLGFGMSLGLIIQRNRETNIQRAVSRSVMIRKISFEMIGFSLVFIVASFAGSTIGQWVGNAIEQSRPGLEMIVGLVAGMLSSFGAAWGMGRFWRKIARFDQ